MTYLPISSTGVFMVQNLLKLGLREETTIALESAEDRMEPVKSV